MSNFKGNIGIYSDITCKKEVNTIGWDNGYILTLINGEKEELYNTALEGEEAIATIFIKNLTTWMYVQLQKILNVRSISI